jgi:hypothetical protein
MVLDAGRRVVGTDQSAGMLARARARFPAVPTEKVGLQELADETATSNHTMCGRQLPHLQINKPRPPDDCVTQYL